MFLINGCMCQDKLKLNCNFIRVHDMKYFMTVKIAHLNLCIQEVSVFTSWNTLERSKSFD